MRDNGVLRPFVLHRPAWVHVTIVTKRRFFERTRARVVGPGGADAVVGARQGYSAFSKWRDQQRP
jgi:hypothetical protein